MACLEASRSKDAEIAKMREVAYGVEVHDVDAGVTRIEMKQQGDIEPPAERVRREQDARARVSEMYQQQLVEVKKEAAAQEERQASALRSVVDAKVREALEQVAEAMECACCLETLGARSVAFTCGHTYCNRASCASAQATKCPECQQAVTARVTLFGALANVESVLTSAGREMELR